MEASASSINLMVSGIDRNSSETVPGAMSRIYGNSLRFRDVSVRSASLKGAMSPTRRAKPRGSGASNSTSGRAATDRSTATPPIENGNESVQRRVGSKAEGEREELGRHPRTIATCVRATVAQ